MIMQIDAAGNGVFFIDEKGKRTAEMVVSITNRSLFIFHADGHIKSLTDGLVTYAKKHNLKIIVYSLYILPHSTVSGPAAPAGHF
jgi:hypothetical protein